MPGSSRAVSRYAETVHADLTSSETPNGSPLLAEITPELNDAATSEMVIHGDRGDPSTQRVSLLESLVNVVAMHGMKVSAVYP
jgi:hypothetical protein